MSYKLKLICYTLGTILHMIPNAESAYALECYTCSSATDKDCASNPGQQIDVEECGDGDECVTTIINGITYRGCLSKIIPSKVCGKDCEKCIIPLCNKNIYPGDRLRCYQCIGANCVTLPDSLNHLPCPIYAENDKCVTNIISENSVIRDCLSTTREESCKNICLKCNYDGCNNEPGITEHTCIQCSATAAGNNECKRLQQLSDVCHVGNSSTCTSKILHGHKGKCFTYQNEDTEVVNRGCSTNMGFYPTGRVSQCFGEKCNQECLDIKCVACDSTTDPRCRESPNSLKAITCDKGTVSCFSCEKDKKLTRGCGSGPADGAACSNCFGLDGCNKENVRSCYQCTSLQNENCATLDRANEISREVCSNSKELCAATVVEKLQKAYIVRGCEKSLVECTAGDPYCERCEGSLCNDNTLLLRHLKNAILGKTNTAVKSYIHLYLIVFIVVNMIY